MTHGRRGGASGEGSGNRRAVRPGEEGPVRGAGPRYGGAGGGPEPRRYGPHGGYGEQRYARGQYGRDQHGRQYGPGRYQPGQAAPGGYDQTQYGPREYVPGPRAAGEYGPPEYGPGAGEYGPPEYGPGQRAPGEYGPREYGSGQRPPRRHRPGEYGPGQRLPAGYRPGEYGPPDYAAGARRPRQYSLREDRARHDGPGSDRMRRLDAMARGGPPGGGLRKTAPGRSRPPRRRRIWLWTASIASVLVLLTGVAGYGLYAKLDGNLDVVNAFGGLGNRPAAAPGGVQNILLLGSQTRNGQRGGKALFGTDPNTNLSDNLILVHLYAGGTHATVVSIPRDTMVYEPACKSASGHGSVPAKRETIIDGAMNTGGPSCAVATVEHLTGIRMDHFVRFDFNSFRTMTNAVGGVQVCLPQAVNDPYSHLKLAAGRHVVKGNQALAFVRTRHGVGNGGDLGRIQLQQEFMSSLIQKILSQGTLTNPVALARIANSATRALTVDPGLGSVAKLVSLATSLRHLHAKNIEFLTMPTVQDHANADRLLPKQPQDDLIWQMLRDGTVWHGHLPMPSARTVRVKVLNGGGVAGLAKQAATALRKRGFQVVSVGNATAPVPATVLSFGAGQAGSAQALASALDQAPAGTQTGNGGPVTLTLGPDFSGVKPPPASTASAGTHAASRTDRGPGRSGRHGTGQPGSGSGQSGSVQARNAGENICSGVPAANHNLGPAG